MPRTPAASQPADTGPTAASEPDPGPTAPEPAESDTEAVYEAVMTLPNPDGGAHQAGDRFLAKPNDPRVLSNGGARLVEGSDEKAPDDVSAALGSSG